MESARQTMGYPIDEAFVRELESMLRVGIAAAGANDPLGDIDVYMNGDGAPAPSPMKGIGRAIGSGFSLLFGSGGRPRRSGADPYSEKMY